MFVTGLAGRGSPRCSKILDQRKPDLEERLRKAVKSDKTDSLPTFSLILKSMFMRRNNDERIFRRGLHDLTGQI